MAASSDRIFGGLGCAVRRVDSDACGPENRCCDHDAAGFAQYLEVRRAPRPQRHVEQGGGTTRVVEKDGILLIDAGGADGSGHLDMARRAEDHRAHRYQVDARIEQDTPAQCLVVQVVGVIGRRDECAPADDHLHAPDGAARNQSAHRGGRRQKSGPHGFHDEDAVAPGFVGNRTRLARIDREGFLAQHRLPGTHAGRACSRSAACAGLQRKRRRRRDRWRERRNCHSACGRRGEPRKPRPSRRCARPPR